METNRWRFFDADCTLGPYGLSLYPPGVDGSAASLVAKMDELGIADACVASAHALEYSMVDGNERLLEAIRPHPRLHPVWTVGAHHSGEFPHPSELKGQLLARHVRMVKLVLHAGEGYLPCLDAILYDELFSMLDVLRLPLQLDYHSFSQQDGRDLREVLDAWPSLPVIVTIPKQNTEERMLFHLWERCANLHVTLSGYQGLGSIEAVVRRFGPRRLLFSSHFPYFTPLQSMLQVIYSDISDEAKQAIAGETLRSLLHAAAASPEARR